MIKEKAYKTLTVNQRETLQALGCSAENWQRILVTEDFEPGCVRNAHFIGQVKIGRLTGKVRSGQGLEKPSGIYNATVANCTIGDKCRVANIVGQLANYDIGRGVCIENVTTMQTNRGATFGNGVEINVLNEAGGREIIIFNELSAQFAYIMCLHKYRPKLIEKLERIAQAYAQMVWSDRGRVGEGACIFSAMEIEDVNIGPYATVKGVSSLVNGTILSSQEAPTIVGSRVIARDFIIAESSTVVDGAVLRKVYVGQGCQIGSQFSAENSAFFANSEAFLGEACSVFAGPYTVSHHKSSLLIAGLFSFYNAGSGTNQSNHMYKLGPIHEGKLLRGTKTGSFSYMMWPCRTGPFSVVLGKHSSNFDVADYPFSHLDARADGKSIMIPGLHLTTVGTVRDEAKWPARDRRQGPHKRDIICFDVFSPYTVGKMIKANALLKKLQESTDKSVEEVTIGGAVVRRPILRTGQKFYRTGIHMYLLEKVFEKAEKVPQDAEGDLSRVFRVEGDAVFSREWLDIGGQLMPKQRLVDLEDAVERGEISTIEDFAGEIARIKKAYLQDEWIWVRRMYEETFEIDLEKATKEDVIEAARNLLEVKSKFLRLVTADARKEFSELSRYGFGQDGTPEDVEKDFYQVSGLYEENKFVREMRNNIEQLERRIEQLVQRLQADSREGKKVTSESKK
ncbi:MAG: hypothetical protein AMJ79_05630 [Phycisphaerae bacterium SM23_30]|nr:MAG: hypothetical protein AMJ79_05630 [Phycisphaerae bacterium SM23_30]